MSHCLSHLEYQGWIKRQVKSTDARSFQIVLKPEGKKKALGLIKYFDAVQNNLEKNFTASSVKKLCDSLDLLKANYIKIC